MVFKRQNILDKMNKVIISKGICAYFVFTAIVFLTYYFVEENRGTVLIMAEVVLLILAITWYGIRGSTKGVAKLYVCFILYRLLISLFVGSFYAFSKPIIYNELGVFVLLSYLVREENCEKIIMKLRDIGFFLSMVGCAEFVLRDSILLRIITVSNRLFGYNTIGTTTFRVRTVFGHPIICGIFEVIFWTIISTFPFKNRILNTIAKCSIIICLIGTQARSAWISFAIVAIIIWVNGRRTQSYLNSKKIVYIMLSIATVFIIAMCFKTRIDDILPVISTRLKQGIMLADETNNRLAMLRRGVVVWRNANLTNKLFGHGMGYALFYLRQNPIRGWSTAVDNQYITLLLDCGVIGLMLCMIVLLLIIKVMFVCNNESVRMCCICLIAMYVSGFFYEFYSWTFVMLIHSTFFHIIAVGLGLMDHEPVQIRIKKQTQQGCTQ